MLTAHLSLSVGSPIYKFSKWILAQKFGILKVQFTDHMKLKKGKTKVWITCSFLGWGPKYPWRRYRNKVWNRD
jgi:hypothetical protein